MINLLRWLAAASAILLATTLAHGQAPVHPLKPLDRSTPRAALQAFLESGDAVGEFMAREYLPTPSRERFQRLFSLVAVPRQFLDLSEVPPAAQLKVGGAAALHLYEVLGRIPLPPVEEIPDAGQLAKPVDAKSTTRWVIPNTEIVLVRAAGGPRSGEFLFSPATVARAAEFYERVRNLPYVRKVPMKDMRETLASHGGWMIPYRWVQALPAAMRVPLAQMEGWKWLGLALILGAAALFVWLAYRLSHLGSVQRPFHRALAQLALPASVLAAMPAIAYLALFQLQLTGPAGSAIELAVTAVLYLAGAWLSWRLAPVVAEAIILSPGIASTSIDAHLIRMSARLLGIVGSITLLLAGGERLGVPVYGIVAGLGVGGLAIALAAQPSIENLIGGLNLFADKPIRVGDLCQYGEQIGTVEAIGIRSTQIRGIDRKLTTIPNAALAKMPIVNFTRRDRMLIKTVIGLRYETNSAQLELILGKLREFLLGHPRINADAMRVRLVGFGASSLDVEMFAYVMTTEWAEFLAIREGVLLRVMDIVEEGGSAIAFPSQTLYLGRDRAPDARAASAAEAPPSPGEPRPGA